MRTRAVKKRSFLLMKASLCELSSGIASIPEVSWKEKQISLYFVIFKWIEDADWA
jgi:hypothetical protein